jgi:hypothetical protein
MQWKVLVMGLKNAGSQFQRMMEWVLREHPTADPYIDDVLVGSTGNTVERTYEQSSKHWRNIN